MLGTDQAQELDTLLDREHSALLAGDLERVIRQSKSREKLLSNLDSRVGSHRLNALRTKLLRNQTLLEAAMDGLRSVQKRMTGLKGVQNALQTYSPTGQVTPVDTRLDGRLERRF